VNSLRGIVIAVLVALIAYAGYRWYAAQTARPGIVSVYYTKVDGQTLVKWPVSLGKARDLKSVAFYAAVQTVAGPPPGVEAIRFPPGTVVRHVDVTDKTATVDLNFPAAPAEGIYTETGEFKSLVWTLTALPGIDAVSVRVNGQKTATLPGGHFELDEPLARSNF
jgi:spore germination protein GerM